MSQNDNQNPSRQRLICYHIKRKIPSSAKLGQETITEQSPHPQKKTFGRVVLAWGW